MPTLDELGNIISSEPTLDTIGAGAGAMPMPQYLRTIDNVIASRRAAQQDVFGSPGGLPIQAADIPQPTGPTTTGRQTWFNPRPYNYVDPATGISWLDTSARALREGPHASGLPLGTPGFATVGRQGLGGWHQVTLPDGRQYIVQKTDIGPPGVVDLNAAFASKAYPQGPQSVASGRTSVQYIGPTLPEGMTPGPVLGGWETNISGEAPAGGVGYVPAGRVAQGGVTDPRELVPQQEPSSFFQKFMGALGKTDFFPARAATPTPAPPKPVTFQLTPIGRNAGVAGLRYGR